MSRVCEISGKRVLTGNNVSHSNRKTRRRFLPNLQQVTLVSESTGEKIRLRVTAHALRTIEFHGGIDGYVRRTARLDLPAQVRQLKKRLEAQTVAA
jgi:large subunit ribosomal protein L28